MWWDIATSTTVKIGWSQLNGYDEPIPCDFFISQKACIRASKADRIFFLNPHCWAQMGQYYSPWYPIGAATPVPGATTDLPQHYTTDMHASWNLTHEILPHNESIENLNARCCWLTQNGCQISFHRESSYACCTNPFPLSSLQLLSWHLSLVDE